MNRGYQNLKQLESATVEAVEELQRQIVAEGAISNRNLANAISGESQARNKMADDQRTYVDRADNQVRRDAAALLDTFTTRGFWSRLNWLFTGR